MFYQDPFDVIIIGGGHAIRRLAALGKDTW